METIVGSNPPDPSTTLTIIKIDVKLEIRLTDNCFEANLSEILSQSIQFECELQKNQSKTNEGKTK